MDNGYTLYIRNDEVGVFTADLKKVVKCLAEFMSKNEEVFLLFFESDYRNERIWIAGLPKYREKIEEMIVRNIRREKYEWDGFTYCPKCSALPNKCQCEIEDYLKIRFKDYLPTIGCTIS